MAYLLLQHRGFIFNRLRAIKTILDIIIMTIDNGQLWSIEFYTCGNVLTHERKVLKLEAKLSISNIFMSMLKHF